MSDTAHDINDAWFENYRKINSISRKIQSESVKPLQERVIQYLGVDLASGPDLTVEVEFNRDTGEIRAIRELDTIPELRE